MSMFIYDFSPTFTLALLTLSFMFKIYRRSVSTFVIILVSAVVSNINHYGYQDYSSVIVLISLIFLMIRAMVKPTNDHWIHYPYHGIEKRKKRKKHEF